MQIEEGKFYKTRDGRKVGPKRRGRLDDFPFRDNDGNWWTVNGYHERVSKDSNIPEEDLIAEWADEPDTLTVARIEFNGGIGNARAILSNGMALDRIIHIDAKTSGDDVTIATIVVRVG